MNIRLLGGTGAALASPGAAVRERRSAPGGHQLLAQRRLGAASQLSAALTRHDVPVWIDCDSLDGTADFTAGIESAIDAALWSSASPTAPFAATSFVRQEIHSPIHIATVSYIDFFDRWDDALAVLLDRLHGLRSEPAARPTDPFRGHLERLDTRLGAPAADLLTARLIGQDPRRSWQAGTILVRIGRPAVPALRRRRGKAGSPQQRMRINAVLGDIATTRTARPGLPLPHDR
jgi:hypothetical protein